LRERGGAFENVDALFDDGKNPPTPVRFVGESGDFEPGKIAKAEKAKLDAVRKFPSDPGPIDIVQQLLIWLPDDQRLFWLLGELYNAAADLTDVTLPTDGEERRKILNKSGDDLAAAKFIFESLGKDAGGLRTKEFWSRRQILLNAPAPEPTSPTPTPVDAKPVSRPGIEWRSLWVGFGTGAAVALFSWWQIKEWRRRRHG
jgi:hypothetical protein